MSAGGTVALLARALAAALVPLRDALHPEAAGALFAELGLGLPAPVLADAGFRTALDGARGVADALPEQLDRLATAITADDDAGTAAATAALLASLGRLRTRLGTLGQALRSQAGAFPTVPAGELTSFADALPARLLELLVIGRMEAAAPGLVGGLVIAGLIDRHDEPGAGGDPARPPFTARRLRLDRLPDLLGSLPDHLRTMYGWGAPGFTGQALLARLADVARHVGLPTLLTTNAGPAQLDLLVGTLTAEPGGLRAELRFGLPAGRTITLPLPQPGWRLTLTAEPALPTGLVARLTPPGTLAVTGAGITGTLRAQLDWTTARPDRPLVVLGEGGGTRLEIAAITAHATARLAAAAGGSSAEPAVELVLGGARFVLALGRTGGLLAALLPADVLRADLDLAIGIAGGRVYLRGGAGLLATFPVRASLGPAELVAVVLGLTPGAGRGRRDPARADRHGARRAGPAGRAGGADRAGRGAELPGRWWQPRPGAAGAVPASAPPTGLGVDLELAGSGRRLPVRRPAGQRYAGGCISSFVPRDHRLWHLREDRRRRPVLRRRARRSGSAPASSSASASRSPASAVWSGSTAARRRRPAARAPGQRSRRQRAVLRRPGEERADAAGRPGRVSSRTRPAFVIGPTLQIGWLAPIVRLDLAILIELPGPSKIIISARSGC